jgi:hypothetical protein
MPDSGKDTWKVTKEKLLMFAGLILIVFEAAASVLVMSTFRFELVLAGLALCGVSIAQWGDKNGREK